MCEITTLALIAAGTAASAAIGGISAAGQASAQKNQAEYQAQVAENNAQLALQQRSDAMQRGEDEASRAMLNIAQMAGKQRAALSANGVDITQGSALDQLATTQFYGQADINTIQSNAAREAWGYDVQAANYQNEAANSKATADNINPALIGGMSAGQSLLGSASQYAMSSYTAKKEANKARTK